MGDGGECQEKSNLRFKPSGLECNCSEKKMKTRREHLLGVFFQGDVVSLFKAMLSLSCNTQVGMSRRQVRRWD